MTQTPIAGETFGRDANQFPALGGFSAALAPVGAKMITDATVPEIGALVVAVEGGSGPVATNLEGGRLSALAATAVNLLPAVGNVSTVIIRNHDGQSPNGNADNIFVGLDASVDSGNHIYVLEPGEGIGFAINDPTLLWVYAAGNVTLCYTYAG